MNDKPLWGRCSLRRNRWYWVVYRNWDDIFDQADPIATGYATSPEECEAAALEVEPEAVSFRSGLAEGHHRKLRVQRWMEKATDQKNAVEQEYLYTDHGRGDYWDGQGDWLYSQRHRIFKKAKRSVFVEKDQWRPDEGWRTYDVETYRLDRAELDATGEVRSRQARDRFYTKPREERRQKSQSQEARPRCLIELDLPAGAIKAQIKSQYRRLAKLHHPDCGGNAEDFKRIQAAYERAILKATA